MTYKFMAPAIGPRNSDTAGLKYRAYSTYSGSASDSPDPASLVSGSLSSTEGVSTQISNFSIGTSTTYLWRGYFKPDATSTSWQFRTTSDDGSYLWLDGAAESPVASLDTANAIVDNGGVHVLTTVASSNQSLDSELYYAITLIAGNNTGPGSASLEWRRDGGPWSSSGASYLSHDSRYVDGFGADSYTASDPTTWGIVGADGAVGSATGSTPTNWTGYRDPADASSNDFYYIAYGKDGNGDPLWVRTNYNSNRELGYSSDVTTDGTWTDINLTGRRYVIKWSNDKWIAIGAPGNSDIVTSSNGTSWGYHSIAGLQEYSTTTGITALASDGGNNWIFGQGPRVYASNDHGDNWYLLNDFADSSIIREAQYSNDKWYVFRTLVGGVQVEKVAVATNANSSSWTDSADLTIGNVARHMWACVSTGSASESTVIVVNASTVCRSTDSGATFTKDATALPHGDARSVAGDGTGTWVVTHDSGRISYSSDDGETWSSGTPSAIVFDSGTEDVDQVAPSKYLPV